MPVSNDLLRKQLESERDRLNNELKQRNVSGHENLGYSTHMADDASAAFDQARDLALRGNLEQSLQQVQEALNRLDNGTFGVCEACDQPVDPARLEALPQARYCLSCQERLEH